MSKVVKDAEAAIICLTYWLNMFTQSPNELSFDLDKFDMPFWFNSLGQSEEHELIRVLSPCHIGTWLTKGKIVFLMM